MLPHLKILKHIYHDNDDDEDDDYDGNDDDDNDDDNEKGHQQLAAVWRTTKLWHYHHLRLQLQPNPI